MGIKQTLPHKVEPHCIRKAWRVSWPLQRREGDPFSCQQRLHVWVVRGKCKPELSGWEVYLWRGISKPWHGSLCGQRLNSEAFRAALRHSHTPNLTSKASGKSEERTNLSAVKHH
ncbi:hypothetical protein QQF64_033454 [Cirrhinus molitorella]|uniref:Uncharacterized protein n=1 Tax=Cirrhinus molitorella TaxID=172907 RepID=A0ABR3MTX4_9TELE